LSPVEDLSLLVDPLDLVVTEGHSAKFSCKLVDASRDENVSGRLFWEKLDADGVMMDLGRGAYDSGNGILSFPNVKSEHTGSYICKTTKVTAQPLSGRMTLRVTSHDNGSTASITYPLSVEPPTLQLSEGENADAICRISIPRDAPEPGGLVWSVKRSTGDLAPLPMGVTQRDGFLFFRWIPGSGG
jgi:hypothetical protein